METQTGEDYKVVDLRAEHEAGSIQIQVKCGTADVHGKGRNGRGGYLSVRLTRAQVARLRRQTEPVYIVYVRIPEQPRGWVTHGNGAFLGPVSAYWARFDRSLKGLTVRVPIDAEFTADTLADWRDDSLAGFTRTGSA